MVNSRRAQTWVWWLLPLLAVRALVPTGFMAQARSGEFKLVLCSAGFLQTQRATDDPSQTSHGSNAASHCPFACAGGAALPVAFIAIAVAFTAHVVRDATAIQAMVTTREWRAHRVRGPPDFSLF